MRITTKATMRNYKSNLATALDNLNTSRNKVMTGRKFVKSAEDPSSALRASQLERKYVRNEKYIDTVDDVLARLESQEDASRQINDLAMTASKQYGLESLNQTNMSQETRNTYAATWSGVQESIIKALNATYGQSYVFAGADTADVPFSLTENEAGETIVTYRGIDVNTKDPEELEILKEMSKETVYVDLGFGLSDANGNVSDDSAFNMAMSGLSVVGFGQDENGNAKNIALLAGQIADELKKEDFDAARLEELLEAFEANREVVTDTITTIGTRYSFLENTKTRLEDNMLNIETEYDNVVNVESADAIMDFSYAQYAYDAALKIGTNILSQSFIDYMN